jgi:predicted ester cyclase
MTTPEENAATVRELIERVMNEGDIGFAEKTLSEDYVERSPMPGGTADKAGAIAMFNMMRSQTPDMHIEVEEVIASDNKVAVHSTMTGTDTMGFMPGMSPTGKPFRMDAIDVFTFNDAGLNSEHYGVYDMNGHYGAARPDGNARATDRGLGQVVRSRSARRGARVSRRAPEGFNNPNHAAQRYS